MKRLRGKQEEMVDSDGSWAVSYGDMITLLLSFFVLYFNTDFDAQKLEDLKHSLLVDLSEVRTPAQNLTEGAIEKKETLIDLDKKFYENQDAKFIPVGQNVVVEFKNKSFFKSGEVSPTSDAQDTLKRFAKHYIPYAGSFILDVRAFTDSTPVSKRHVFKDNLELSALRAVAAMRVLQNAGIPLDRMQLGGYGENMLLEDEIKKLNNVSESDLNALARKIVIVIKADKKV